MPSETLFNNVLRLKYWFRSWDELKDGRHDVRGHLRGYLGRKPTMDSDPQAGADFRCIWTYNPRQNPTAKIDSFTCREIDIPNNGPENCAYTFCRWSACSCPSTFEIELLRVVAFSEPEFAEPRLGIPIVNLSLESLQ